MKVELGKRYLRRDGTISGVIIENPLTHSSYPYLDPDSNCTFTSDGSRYGWTHNEMDLMVEYIEPVSPLEVSGKENTMEYDLSGLPAGYTFVGYRFVKEGDQYVGNVGGTKVFVATKSDVTLKKLRLIVQPIVPPEPTQRTVAIHKWLVADKAGKECIRFGTAEWVQNCKFKIVVDLGLYAEVKVSV